MAAKIAFRREHTGEFPTDQAQRLAQQGAVRMNAHTDTLSVLANRAYAALSVDKTIAAAAYATLLTVDLNTSLSMGFLIIQFSASGIQITNPATVFFQILIDGVVVKGLYTTVPTAGFSWNAAMVVRVAVTKGHHVVALQWKTNANSVHINAKSTVEEHAHLLVQEAA